MSTLTLNLTYPCQAWTNGLSNGQLMQSGAIKTLPGGKLLLGRQVYIVCIPPDITHNMPNVSVMFLGIAYLNKTHFFSVKTPMWRIKPFVHEI